MRVSFILLGCLFSFSLLQATSECCSGCKRKKPGIRHEKTVSQDICFRGGCGCGGGRGNGANDIPPDND